MKIYSQRNGETRRQAERRDEEREGIGLEVAGEECLGVVKGFERQEKDVKERIEQMRRG